MAILKGIEVNVTVGGEKLAEYDEKFVESDEADLPKCHHFVSKYIEAKPGAEFGIKFVVDPKPDLDGSFAGLTYKLYVDDVFAIGKCISAFPSTDSQAFIIQGKPGHYTRRPLIFANLDQNYTGTLNEATIAEQKRKVAKVGTLRVAVFRSLKIEKVPAKTIFTVGGQLAERNDPVSGKALLQRGNTLRASLGPAQNHVIETLSHTTNMDKSDKPFLVFQFHYRDHNSLRALLIITRTPSPEPLEQRALETLSNAEALELLRQYREREEAQKAIKREDANVKAETTVTEGAGRIKRERLDDDELTEVESRPVKRKFEGPPIVID